MKRLGASLGVLLLLSSAVYFFVGQAPRRGDGGKNLGTVTRQDLLQRVNISGAVSPNRTVTFVPPYEGYVRKIYVRQGQKVKAGDPIVKITPGADDDAFPLRAPFDGMVVQIMRSEGQYVSKTKEDAILRVDDTSKLYVESDAPELDYVKLRVGQDVIVKASAIMSRVYKGKITEIAQASRNQERWERSKVEFPIKVEILDQDEQLKPGMSVVIDVITEEARNALTLRHEFIRKKGEDYVVTMASGEERPVTVGLRNEEAFEIKEGLNEGDQVQPVDFLSM